MSKRPAGSGTVRTIRKPTADAPGRYQALGPSLPDARRPGKRTRVSLYCGPDHAEAERWADEGGRQLAAGEAVHLTGLSLRAWLERYLDAREHDAPRSVVPERSAAKHVLGPLTVAPWADDPIDAIHTPAIQAHLAALARRLPGMAKSAKALLSGAFGAAARVGLVAANPVGSVKLPRQVRTHEPWTWLTAEEQARLLVAPQDEPERLLVTVWLYCGLRSGEILSLRLADVHLDRAEITVRHGSLRGPPKGRKIRTVHLFPPALAAFQRWLELLPAYLGTHRNRHGLAFPGPRGGQRGTDDAFEREGESWAQILEAAGILRAGSAAHRHDGQTPRPHDAFRHSCGAALASGMWTDEPWQPQEVQKHLGHATLRETERYMHLAPSVVRGKASRVQGVTHGMEHAASVLRGDSRSSGDSAMSTGGYPALPALPDDSARRAPSVTQQLADALDAAARHDPHAGRLLVEACGAALRELEQIDTDQPAAQPRWGRR